MRGPAGGVTPAAGPWLVVGLGNPGPRYAGHRHNIGYHVIAELAEELGAPRGQLRAHKSGRADVFELVVDVQRHLAQPDDQTENRDRRDQNQLSRDNETSFVVLQGVDELEHVRVFHSWGLLSESL